MEVIRVPYGSALYHESVELREALLRRPLGMTFSEYDLRTEPDDLMLGIVLDGVLVGSGVYIRQGDTLNLHFLAVKPDLQKGGVGTKILLEGERIARAEGYRRIRLDSRMDVISFYLKNGYVHDGEAYVLQPSNLVHQPMEKLL